MFKLLIAVSLLLSATTGWTASAPSGTSVKGTVLEIKDVNEYTYLRLQTKEGETWAAVSRAAVPMGAEVTVENAMVMNNFESKSLHKTFDKIVFGNLAGAGAGAASAGGSLGQFHQGVSQAPGVLDAKVPKARGPDAKTIAEIVGAPAELKDKPVTVRGKVVKLTPNVMDKNWIHLRDGSGSAADNTNDILVTTRDRTKVGDIVIVKGTVRQDVNIGAGYSYKVLIDDATLQK